MSPTKASGEHELMGSLGISLSDAEHRADEADDFSPDLLDADDAVDANGCEVDTACRPNGGGTDDDQADVDWNDEIRAKAAKTKSDPKASAGVVTKDSDLDALEELVPDVKNRRSSNEQEKFAGVGTAAEGGEGVALDVDEYEAALDGTGAAKVESGVEVADVDGSRRLSMASNASSTFVRNITAVPPGGGGVSRVDSMRVQRSKDFDDSTKPSGGGDAPSPVDEGGEYSSQGDDEAGSDMYEGLDGNDSDVPAPGETEAAAGEETKIPKEFLNISSGQSLSTATQTQTHEVRMPMYLPTFKPATGCTNASDFIVRCFVARLRSGITVVKHGRSRWCKSRLRILHIHPDGCSLSWKPAEGEPTSNRRPPKLDLTQCLEVRHAWSPDSQNPMYTGTPILRQKCEAANAHKSFALIFPKRTVDITAVTADQCKVLMEGFSALCFRLQVADLAGKGANKKGGATGRGMPEEDGVSTTASVTLTNSSTPRAR